MGKINLENIDPKGQQKREAMKERREGRLRNYEEALGLIESSMLENIRFLKEKISSFEGVPENILGENGQINPYAFTDKYSGPEIDQDMVIVKEKKKGFYKTYDPAVQERYGETDQLKLIELIENNEKEKMRDGNISEDLLFILLNKVSDGRYLRVRSSDYDDYENGTDMLLIDTESNAVICAFDATVSGVNSRMDHKIERAKERVDSGRGMRLKYGISFEKLEDDSKKINLGPVRNLSPLFLDLKKEDLQKLLQIMDFGIESDVCETEKEVMSTLLKDLLWQINELENRSAKNISYESSKEFLLYVKDLLSS